MEKSGIYKIANKITGDFYIGSSIEVKRRFREHKSNLYLQRHTNAILQRVFNKYGAENLQFEVIEYTNKEDLIYKEQLYLDKLKPRYNILKIANNSFGYKHTEETKKRMSAFQKTIKRTEEFKLKHSKLFKIKSPDGEIVEGINLRRFCKENNLDDGHMGKVIHGKYKHHKGWTAA